MERQAELEYLKARQKEELSLIEANIQQLEQYKQDYQSLRDRVEVLPNKTRHEVMVPIAGSKMALMPGYIHHTNEFMVMIGEDYFVEMSAKETMQFVDRRMAFCDEKLKELNDNKKLVNDWIKVSTETCSATAGGLEFIHEETEEEYQEWMRKHESLQKTSNKSTNVGKDSTKEKIDLTKFFDKYKDDDDEEEEQEKEKENEQEEEPDSDDDPAPVQQTEPIRPKPEESIKMADIQQVSQRSIILPTVSEQTKKPPANRNNAQSSQSTRPMSHFRASRMK